MWLNGKKTNPQHGDIICYHEPSRRFMITRSMSPLHFGINGSEDDKSFIEIPRHELCAMAQTLSLMFGLLIEKVNLPNGVGYRLRKPTKNKRVR